MKVLITGGAGFVGLGLAEALLAHGHSVVCFDLRPPPDHFLLAIGDARHRLDVCLGDVCDDLPQAFASGRDAAPITHVFHGAAITPDAAREVADARRIVEVNLQSGIEVVRIAAAAGVHRLVFPSSLHVYGESLYGNAELDEATTPPAPQSLYAITKYAAERAVLTLGGRLGLDVVCGRIGAVFGPWETDSQIRDLLTPYHQIAAAAARGQAVVLPEPYASREMVYVRDLAEALLLLLTCPRHAFDIYNLSVNADWRGLMPRWCDLLTQTLAGFSWRYARPNEVGDIRFPDNRPRTSMATARLRKDLHFEPRFFPDSALADYCAWLVTNARFLN